MSNPREGKRSNKFSSGSAQRKQSPIHHFTRGVSYSDRCDQQCNSELQGEAAGGVKLGNDTILLGATWIQFRETYDTS